MKEERAPLTYNITPIRDIMPSHGLQKIRRVHKRLLLGPIVLQQLGLEGQGGPKDPGGHGLDDRIGEEDVGVPGFELVEEEGVGVVGDVEADLMNFDVFGVDEGGAFDDLGRVRGEGEKEGASRERENGK
jgi:hypothetical protein